MFEVFTSPIPALTAADFGFRAARINESVGRAVVERVRDNFHSLPPNAMHFPSTGFWRRAAEATTYEILPDGVRIVVDQVGIRQRLLGGPINPVKGRFLTIPAIAAAYGHRAADFDNLKPAWVMGNGPGGTWAGFALVSADAIGKPAGQFNPESVYFWLVSSVEQLPNPRVLPSDEALGRAALDAILEAMK